MTSGWRYSAQVPDFTKEERHGEEIVVVDVLVQAPGTTEPAPPTTVWRRFSEFRQLYANVMSRAVFSFLSQLKGAYPDLFKSKQLEPPSKRSFRFVNNNDRLLNERRQQLEAWLWKLLSHGEVARSQYMRMFLQLNLAMRGATTEASIGGGREEDEQLDTASDISAPSGVTHLSHAMTDVATPGTGRYSMKTESLDVYRMGLRVEQRRELKQLMKIIASSLEQISRDAAEVKGENRSLQQENRSLEDQIASLHQTIKDGTCSKDEKYEELMKALEEKETSLKRSHAAVHQLEMDLKESKRTTEALEGELRSVKCDAAVEMEKKTGDMAVVESKMQSQSVALAKLEQQLMDTKRQARQDHRVLAEAVKTLRQEKAALASTVHERDERLKDYAQLQANYREAEAEGKLLKGQIETTKSEMADLKAASEKGVQAAQDQARSKLREMKDRHTHEVASMQEAIEKLHRSLEDVTESRDGLLTERDALQLQMQSMSSEGSHVRLVIEVQRPSESTDDSFSPTSENDQLKETIKSLSVEDNASPDLQRQIEELVTKNQELEHRLKVRPSDQKGEVANLDGLMMTIQHLRDENEALQATSSASTSTPSFNLFVEEIKSICRALEKCTMTGKHVDGPLTPEEANGLIERITDNNCSISELSTKINDLQSHPSGDNGLPTELVTALVRLLMDYVQKSNEMNETMIQALLSFGSTDEGGSKSNPSLPKRPSPKPADGQSATPDGSNGDTPSMKSFFGGIGAKMSQSSQGFMSFMQRGAIPPENDPMTYARRDQQ